MKWKTLSGLFFSKKFTKPEPCSTQLRMKFVLPMKKIKYQQFKPSSCTAELSMRFFLLMNIKMPTIVGILIFISKKNFMLN